METDESTNSSGNILKIEEIEGDEILKNVPNKISTLRPISPTTPDLAITSASRSPSNLSSSGSSRLNLESGNPSQRTAVEYLTGNEDSVDTNSSKNIGSNKPSNIANLQHEGSHQMSVSPRKSKRVSLMLDRPHSAMNVVQDEDEEECKRIPRPRVHSISVTKPLVQNLATKEKKRSKSPQLHSMAHTLAAKLKKKRSRSPRTRGFSIDTSQSTSQKRTNAPRLEICGELNTSVSSESISWNSCYSKKSDQDLSRGSSNALTSGSLSPSPTATRLLPLQSASVCVERSFRFGSQYAIDTADQLESCFADRHLRVYVCTWNMGQTKVGEINFCFFYKITGHCNLKYNYV